MSTDPRVSRRGVRFTPRRRDVEEAARQVKLGMPIPARWLPFLSPSLRMRAIVKREMESV